MMRGWGPGVMVMIRQEEWEGKVFWNFDRCMKEAGVGDINL
jgi:hypothetical protein